MRGPADLLAYRELFPAVERTVFLGAHTLAPLARPVRAAIDRFLDVWEAKASAERVWFEDVIPEMRRLEGLYAQVIGADPGEVVLTPSVSTGLSSLASALTFTAGRHRVLLARDEFPTDCHVWLAQQRRGAEVRWLDGKDERAYLDALDASTAVVSASRVSYLDGALLDAEALVAGCRGAGALCILDDYHGSGVVPLDVGAIGADALVGGPLKYLLGGPGIAFLYVRSDLAADLEPTVTGWFSQADFFAFDGSRLDWPATAQRFAMGTPSPAAVYAAVAGLELVLDVGVDRIRARTLELTGYVIGRAVEEGYVVRTPADPVQRGAMVAFEVPRSTDTLHHLLERDVIVDERHGALRVCPHFFTSEDDVDAMFDALRPFRH
ncbi:MAG: aminotransferase class V-fold PLP-dependent enzyme [Actinomycetota bacterium]